MSPESLSDAARGPDPPDGTLEVHVTASASEVTARLEGELDFTVAPGFLAKMDDALSATKNPAVHLDLTGLRFLDTDGARALLSVSHVVAGAGGRLTVDGMPSGRFPVADHLALYELLVGDDGMGDGHRT